MKSITKKALLVPMLLMTFSLAACSDDEKKTVSDDTLTQSTSSSDITDSNPEIKVNTVKPVKETKIDTSKSIEEQYKYVYNVYLENIKHTAKEGMDSYQEQADKMKEKDPKDLVGIAIEKIGDLTYMSDSQLENFETVKNSDKSKDKEKTYKKWIEKADKAVTDEAKKIVKLYEDTAASNTDVK